MRWMLLAASAVIAASLWLPSHAASPADPAASAAAGAPTSPATGRGASPGASEESITFDAYREWRLRFIEQRQTQLAARLAATTLTAAQRSRLEQQKGYYDWFAGLPEADRNHRFRERFDQIDANHDGKIDPAERAAWHEKQRAFYDRGRRGRQQAVAHEAE